MPLVIHRNAEPRTELKCSPSQSEIQSALTKPLQDFSADKFGEMILLKHLGCIPANFESFMILFLNSCTPQKRKTVKQYFL